jgi:uncharacterized protein YceK
MMKRVILYFILVSVLLLGGCGTTTVTDSGKVTTGQSGNTVTTTVETDEGKQTTTVTGEEGADSWCPEGGNWQMESTGAEGDASATWKIDKLETSGEYKGLCHVIYTVDGPDGKMVMDYWFDESGENGYYEMEINGQKIKQEWHG